MKSSAVALSVAVVFALFASASCSRKTRHATLPSATAHDTAHGTAHGISPNASASAVGEQHADPSVLRPLVVGASESWQRQLLDLADRGLVAIAYRRSGLLLLPRCTLAGTYGYAVTATVEHALDHASHDAVRRNFPALGVEAEGSHEFGVQSVASGSIARTAVLSSALSVAYLDELDDSCQHATHFVQTIELGSHRAAGQGAAAVATGACGPSYGKELSAQCRPLALRLTPLGARRDPRQWAASVIRADSDVYPCSKEAKRIGALCVDAKSECVTEASSCERECDQGNPWACARRAALVRDGATDEDALRQRIKWRAKACDGGHGSSCLQLGLLVEETEKTKAHEALHQPRGVALQVLQSACDKGSGPSCRGYAQTLSSSEQSRALLYRACLLGDGESCGALADAVFAVEGVSSDLLTTGYCAWRLACEGGDALRCWSWGRFVSKNVDRETKCTAFARGLTAPDAWRRGCHRGSRDSCARAAQRPEAMSQELRQALLTAGCSGDEPNWQACLLLGRSYEQQSQESSLRQALHVYRKLCDMRVVDGCSAGERLAVRVTDTAALQVFLHGACVASDASACVRLAHVLTEQSERTSDPALREQATGWLKQACQQLGFRRACDELKERGK